jgi:tryptophan synthase beta subunit
MHIHGDVKPGQGFTLAGAAINFAGDGSSSLNLTSKPNLTFWVKAEKNTYYRVQVSTLFSPFPKTVKLLGTGLWEYKSIPLSEFGGLDPVGISGIFFGRGSPGTFDIHVDDVEFK